MLLGSTAVALERALRSSIDRRVELTRLVGEIRRLDEVLTMSARLYTAAPDPALARRYDEAASDLDRALGEALALSASEEAAAAVQATDAANTALVEVERAAFARCDAGDCAAAAARLRDDRYRALKRDYAHGMATAFAHIHRRANQHTALRRVGLVLSLLLLAVVGAMIVFLRMRVRRAEVEAARREAQLEALRVTVSTVMDTVNNALNNLQLFRMKAEESPAFDDEDLALFDRVVHGTSERLSRIGAMEEFRVDDGGPLPVLDVDRDQANARAASSSVAKR